jgi:hypothetical protein
MATLIEKPTVVKAAVRYGTPEPDGAEYIAVCLPAFAPGIVHRDNA